MIKCLSYKHDMRALNYFLILSELRVFIFVSYTVCNLVQDTVNLRQLDSVLIGTIVKAEMPIVIVGVARLREAVQHGKHVFETVAMHVFLADWYKKSIASRQSDLSYDAHCGIAVNENHQLDSLI